MTRQEYEYLQERLSKLLNKQFWMGRNEGQGYRNGVLAAKSLVKEVFEHQKVEAQKGAKHERIEGQSGGEAQESGSCQDQEEGLRRGVRDA